MIFSPLPPYFIVKIDKNIQSQKREKIGSLYLHFKEVFMQRNLQYGEIVGIGLEPHKIFPDCKIGDTLIFHHFVEGSETSSGNIIHSDSEFNYYYVTSIEFNGHRNETYGYSNEVEIIPHPEFIFLKNEEVKKEAYESNDDYINKNTQKVGSLILFNEWTESREDMEEKAQTLMTEIKNQSKGKSMSDSTKRALESKQKDASNITMSLNKKEYESFEIAYVNQSLQKSYNIDLKEVKNVYSISLAAQTELEIKDNKYKIISTRYCAAVS